MPTPLQLRLVHIAARQIGLPDERYRMLLRNVAGVDSAKDLTQAGFEDVAAILEDMGFRDATKAGDYWRNVVAIRGSLCGPRMVNKIMSLRGAGSVYGLPGLCKRVSGGRVDRVDRLTPREGWEMVEMLKAMAARGEGGGDAGAAGDETGASDKSAGGAGKAAGCQPERASGVGTESETPSMFEGV